MATAVTEDYLKQIYLLGPDDRGLVSMGRLAGAMDVVPGTATAMVKRLADAGLVRYEPYSGVKLTIRGRREALRVLRRHRLIETFLVETLDVDWSEVHEEAEHLEHALSDKLLDRIDAFLGRPRFDPHGDPIPTARGDIRSPRHRPLVECESGSTYRIARVTDQDPSFLQFVDRHDLRPGRRIVLQSCDRSADSVVVKPHRGTPVTMGGAAAAKLLVEAENR